MSKVKAVHPAESSAGLDQRFSTLEKTHAERSRLRSLKAECEEKTPRDRLIDRQLKIVDHFLARHEDELRKIEAEGVAATDEGIATGDLKVADAARAEALSGLEGARAERTRLQDRADAAKAELEELKVAAGEMVATRRAAFDASMQSGDDAAQRAAAEALSNAQHAMDVLSGGSSHPTQLRLTAMLAQVDKKREAVAKFEEQLDAAEIDRDKAQATLAAIACDRATNVALAAYIAATALVAQEARPVLPRFAFFSAERCYARRFVDTNYGRPFVSELAIGQLRELASEPDLQAFDKDPMQVSGLHHPHQQQPQPADTSRSTVSGGRVVY